MAVSTKVTNIFQPAESNVLHYGQKVSSATKIDLNETKKKSEDGRHLVFVKPVWRTPNEDLKPTLMDSEDEEDVTVHIEEPKVNLFNKKPLSKDATTYELEKFKKKQLIIFNQELFDMPSHPRRYGTDKDAETLRDAFEHRDFDVLQQKDLTRDEIFGVLKKFLEKDLSDYGCIAVAILTHGTNNGQLFARDQAYSETQIINEFQYSNNPSMNGKPKLIIIQACRGSNEDLGVRVFKSPRAPVRMDMEPEPYTVPRQSDILIFHSSSPGNVSYRNMEKGSWFIQTLCNQINAFSETQDLETIITHVKKEIAINHEARNIETLEVYKQMPVVISTLTRKLFFRKFDDHTRVMGNIKQNPVSNHTSGQHNTSLYCDNHFNYMKTCLEYYIENNPQDETAKSYCELATLLGDSAAFNTHKEKMKKMIADHLKKNANNCPFFKYIYFNDH